MIRWISCPGYYKDLFYDANDWPLRAELRDKYVESTNQNVGEHITMVKEYTDITRAVDTIIYNYTKPSVGEI
jgi:hypothetical protein